MKLFKSLRLQHVANQGAQFIFPLLLVLITLIICVLNYTPGTFLTGWDTLHPEFNFSSAFSNQFFGAFRTDQGLGAVAAHAHMVELPRTILLWLFHFILPLSFLRYSIVFLCFIAGPLGIFYFVKKVLSLRGTSKTSDEAILNLGQLLTVNWLTVEIPAFLAALVYIFNLETVQQFYVPFEMFLVEYALLGWIFFFAVKYINEKRKTNLITFALITLLASPMAYAPVLWYAFFASFLLFLFSYFLLTRTKKVLKSILIIIGITLLINSYWILPNLYFLATAAGQVSAAQTNKIFSDEAFLYNKQFGNIFDTAILKNFLFSWNQQISPEKSQNLMQFWSNHLNNPLTLAIGYIVFLISIFGIVISIIRKNLFGIASISIFVLSLIMVMNMNQPFELFFSLLRDNFSLFREGLRFPFTKFGPLLIFALSIFFGIGIYELIKLLSSLKNNHFKLISISAFTIIATISLMWYGAPQYTGHLIDPQLRVAIPSDYQEFFDFMNSQDSSARVAPLPLNSMWGWEYYDWTNNNDIDINKPSGYQGAGFIWFGIKQPVLARDFDRWNKENEQYFREMSNAIYSRDSKKVVALAQKFRISYFLLDESMYSPGAKTNQLWHYETKSTFEKSDGKIVQVAKFGKLSLYKVTDVKEGFVQIPNSITSVGPEITGGFVDIANEKLGDYIISNSANSIYPARSLVDRYDRINPTDVAFSDGKLILRLSKNNGNAMTSSWLSDDIFPKFMQDESYDLSTEEKGLPYTVGDDTYFSIPINTAPLNVSNSFLLSTGCGSAYKNSISRVERNINSIKLVAKNGASCGYFSFANEAQDFGSILILEAKNTQGLPLRICMSNELTARCDIYTSLDTTDEYKKYIFMIPPLPSGGKGYALHINNVGIGDNKSVNEVRFVQIVQIPYYRIESLSFDKGVLGLPNGITNLTASEINPTLYDLSVTSDGKNPGLFNLFKAYDPGWRAYRIKNNESRIMNYLSSFAPFIFGTEIKEHVKVNNWANGWIIPNSSTINKQQSIIIIFWPQYLEYAGFLILILTTLFLLVRVLPRHFRRK